MTRVLVVDDDRSIRRSLEKFLGGLGYDVVTAGDGLEALRAAGGADVVLLDLGLPGADGFDVLARLRAEDRRDRHRQGAHRPGDPPARPAAKGPLVTVNCGAIPENLIESELFGHVKGAFTGAVANQIGKFQAADKGTIFLDEVGELPLSLQVKFLRVLQERQVQRVGETRTFPVDVRVVAATNRDLAKEVAAGRFREDLYHRLNVIDIRLPPLRERGQDVPLLVEGLLAKINRELHKDVRRVAPETMAALVGYPWPGNVRELENALTRAVVLSTGEVLEARHLPLAEAAAPHDRRGAARPCRRRAAAGVAAPWSSGATSSACSRRPPGTSGAPAASSRSAGPPSTARSPSSA
jgi:DNA-binding NtrC family response regulator